MAGASVSPSTIGGRFTNMCVFLPQPLVSSQDGGRVNTAGFVGTGSSTKPDSLFIDNGSATGVSGTWHNMRWSEGLKQDPWTVYPGWHDFAQGSREPQIGVDNFFYNDPAVPASPFPASYAYFDNEFSGEAGPDQSAVRSANEWIMVPIDPQNGVHDTGSVKCYPANQFNFTTPTPVSSLGSVTSYASCVNPLLPAASNPLVIYEAAWDIFGHAHYDNTNSDGSLAISLEIMFWTRNHNQAPNIGVKAESGINFGDGRLWDLYMTVSTAANGGVADKYSYCIFVLQDAYQEETGWVDILAGVRYACMHYVKTSGAGAPSNPLDCPLTQITRGWEICSTNYSPLVFRHLDYRLNITQATGTAGPLLQSLGRPVMGRLPARRRGRVRGRA